MKIPKELYTPASLFSLGGSAVAVYLFSNLVVRQIFDGNPAKLGFLFAELIAFVGLLTLPGESFRPGKKLVVLLFVTFCNGMLIYSQSVGFNGINHGVPTTKAHKATFIPLIDSGPWWPPADQQIAIRKAVADVAAAVAPINELAEQLQAPDTIAREQREVAEQRRADSQKRRALLERNLAKASEAERLANERRARAGDIEALRQRVEAQQQECARLERDLGRVPQAMREAALQAYERCSRQLRDARAPLEEAKQAVDALNEITRNRQALERSLAEAVQSEQKAIETVGKLRALEQAVTEARHADQEAGNVVLSNLTGRTRRSMGQLKEIQAQLERAYLPPALSAERARLAN